jgi:hypothetical protein
MLDLLHDPGSGRGPGERTRIPVILSKVLGDGAVEFGDAMKRSASDALAGDFGKPPLHQQKQTSFESAA